ncbi:MAG: transglycosylase SLT domain-containing protein [Gemmatimonadota bacterium]|nr:transglycosylase SLT domain-containing protein [Gemmatimonadota bacterium]
MHRIALLIALCASVAGAQERSTTTLSRAAQARANAKHTARFDPTFKKYSKRYFGVAFDWQRFKAQAMAESNLDTAAVSVVGARGLMQLMPSTYAAIQSARADFGHINDPEWNIAAGIMHDRYLWKKWTTAASDSERVHFMFGSYNAGEGPITRAAAAARARQLEPSVWSSIEAVAPDIPRWRYRETLGYVKKIESNYSKIRAK